jgi:hypothetical protein
VVEEKVAVVRRRLRRASTAAKVSMAPVVGGNGAPKTVNRKLLQFSHASESLPR